MKEEESPIICAGTLIICCNQNVRVIPSILEPSYVVLLLLNQRLNLASKSTRPAVKKVLLAVAVSRFFSKLSANASKSLAIGLSNDIKKQIYIIYLLLLSQN